MPEKNGPELKCSECRRQCGMGAMRFVDDEPVCLNCLYGGAEPVQIWPIGLVVNGKSRIKSGFGTTGGDVSYIRLYPGLARFMEGLADETHLTIVWQLDKPAVVKTMFRRGWDGKQVGPFASRTPERLTPIAITDVELVEVKGTVLTVRGLDAVNGTAVLDIKVAPASLRRSENSETE